jgi:DUF1680 family protein
MLTSLLLALWLTPTQPFKPVPLRQVRIDDQFWAPKIKVWREVTIPDCFAKFEKDGAMANFDRVAERRGGEHGGAPWFDGLVYEMITASSDFLAVQRDPNLEARLDGYIDKIAAAAAQDPDGYLNTYTSMKEPDHRWGWHASIRHRNGSVQPSRIHADHHPIHSTRRPIATGLVGGSA